MLEELSSDLELNLAFDKFTREEYLEHIILLNDNGEEIDHLITIYELKYQSSFDIDFCKSREDINLNILELFA